MLKKTIKFKTINIDTGLEEEDELDAYFNLTKAEAIELNIRNDLELIGRSKDQNTIMDTFQRVLRLSYGVRTGDGKFLKRTPEGGYYFDSFSTTEAYSELFMELFTDSNYALEFIRAILPKEAVEAQEAREQQSQSNIPEHLRNLPSMQGHKAKHSEGSPQQPATPPPAAPAPAAAQPHPLDDPEYRAFLAQKNQQRREALQQDVSAPGVTSAENPQSAPPPSELT